ncbi:Arm DNA-binding domain-containing protein [Microseira sp. BLCC-F43]|jgi:hypothetical protein|uniref:Arm DNA-binding domain-containing protein n=1 Tax=Microseira sp. BLCC-F43 TaxID=3153602 RepID=UPI0035BA3C05
MTDTKITTKRQKGRVTLRSCNGCLQLRFTATGKRHVLSLSLADTPANRKVAQAKAALIESDLAWDRFDPTLEKYKPQRQKAIISSPLTLAKTSFSDLWERYTQFKKSQIAETTIRVKYAQVANHIKKLPKGVTDNAIAIRDYLLATNSVQTAKYVLTQLNAMGKWAEKSKLLDANPFEGISNDIKVKDADYQNIQPFSEVDREAIIYGLYKH